MNLASLFSIQVPRFEGHKAESRTIVTTEKVKLSLSTIKHNAKETYREAVVVQTLL
jgi:hypothetical protein